MGDPAAFEIRHGNNPHTRNRYGLKKHVDRVRAKEQWTAMKEVLERHGVEVHVLPADPERPGLVFPANAGFIPKAGIFVAAHLNPTRAAEQAIYADALQQLGFSIHTISKAFEGQADLIRWGESYLFSYGRLRQPAWSWQRSWPPWQRRYGFRTDQTALPELGDWIPSDKVISIELTDEHYYHGDTLLCSFGPERRFLLAYDGAMSVASQESLKKHKDILWLSDQDAAAFAANSFGIQEGDRHILFMPNGVSATLRRQIEGLGVQTVVIDVSEFLDKGGGAVKCMVFDMSAST